MDELQRRMFLETGPTAHFVIEHVPTVERRNIRGIEWLFGGDNRVVRYSNRDHRTIADNHQDYRVMMQLTQLGLYDVTVEPRWDIEPRRMLPHERGDLDGFRTGNRAQVEYSEVIWRITDKGRNLLAAMNPPPKPRFKFIDVSENECELVIES